MMTKKSPQKSAPKSNKTPDVKIRPGKQPGASA